MSGFAGHIDSWLATARQEKIVSLKGAYEYNPPHLTSETCMLNNVKILNLEIVSFTVIFNPKI